MYACAHYAYINACVHNVYVQLGFEVRVTLPQLGLRVIYHVIYGKIQLKNHA